VLHHCRESKLFAEMTTNKGVTHCCM